MRAVDQLSVRGDRVLLRAAIPAFAGPFAGLCTERAAPADATAAFERLGVSVMPARVRSSAPVSVCRAPSRPALAGVTQPCPSAYTARTQTMTDPTISPLLPPIPPRGASVPATPAAVTTEPTADGYALAAVDIDDTLLGPDWRISAPNAAAISELRCRGMHVVLASGRSHANMLRFHHQLELGDGPVISAQGAVVRTASDGVPWLEESVAPELVARVTRDGLARGFAVQHYRRDEVFVQGRSEWTEYDQSRNESPHRLVDDLLAVDGAGVAKIIWLGDPAEIAAVVADRTAAYASALTVTATDAPYLEFYGAATSKAAALAAVAARLGVARERVLAFGDGNNDAPMLAWAGLGVAMDHATPAARDAAALVAPHGDPETSLARAVQMVLDRVAAPERVVAPVRAGVHG